MSYTLGIDIGTSGVRTAVVDTGGALVSMARVPHLPQKGATIDAALWWDAVRACLHAQAQALSENGKTLQDVLAVAVDGTSGSMVLTDKNVKPVSEALMYNSTGFEGEAKEIARVAPDPHIARGSNSALARAMRLLRNASETPAHLLHQADYVLAKLSGRPGWSDTNNALKTGCNPQDRTWPDWISLLVPDSILPTVVDVGEPLGSIDPSIAKEFGFATDTLVVAGTTDSIAAFLACAPLESGTAVTSLGSTLAVKVLSTQPVDDPSIGLYSHKIKDVWLIGGASNTGGAVLSHYFSNDEIFQLSKEIDPTLPTGLEYYPLLRPGERFPINDPTFSGNLEPRPEKDADFLAGIFEGIADIELRCYRAIEARGGSFPSVIYSAGGGAQNEVFSRIRFDRTKAAIGHAKYDEAAIGAARIAGWALGPS